MAIWLGIVSDNVNPNLSVERVLAMSTNTTMVRKIVDVQDSEGAQTSLIKPFVLGLHIVEGRKPLYSDP
jgi:hypothetical protein